MPKSPRWCCPGVLEQALTNVPPPTPPMPALSEPLNDPGPLTVTPVFADVGMEPGREA